MPHCLHFPYCTRGDACLYSHVHVSPTAKVCKDFVLLGWCERGLECKERHVWECPDFSEKGTCKRKGCKLPHIIRKGSIEGEDDASLFVKDVVGTLKAAASSASGQAEAEVEHSLPNPDDKGKKRALEQDEDEEADSSADEVAGELLNNHKKKQKIAFNPDAVQANEDFVTLMISDTDEGSEEEDGSGDDEEESSVADSEDDDNDKDEEVQQAGISHVFTTSTAAKGSFARRAEREDDDSDDDDIEEDE